MRLDVDTGAYASASDLLHDANHGVTHAMARLASALDRCSGMSGTDSGGRTWAESYDQVAGQLLTAGADLGGAMGAMAGLLDASLANHWAADAAACLCPGPVGGSQGPPVRETESLLPAPLPSALGGVGGEPEGWRWLAGHLEGLLWPDADTGRMRAAGAAWTAAGPLLEGWSSSAAGAAYLLEGQRSPEVPIARASAAELGRHGEELAAACRDVGRACSGYAEQVDEHHAEILGICRDLVTWTVVDEATGAVLSLVTGGGAEVAAQLAESGVLAGFAARVVAVLRRLEELAQAAADLISRGLGRITEVLARLRIYLALRGTRTLERLGVTIVGRRALSELPAEVRQQVDEAIARSRIGKKRFVGHDGDMYRNDDLSHRLPPGEYTEWTAAASGSKRGVYRVLIRGGDDSPDAIYIWDHDGPPVRIGP